MPATSGAGVTGDKRVIALPTSDAQEQGHRLW